MSYVALIGMLTLFLLETKAYFDKSWIADLALDSNTDPKVRVNFNITMMDLKCEWAVVDAVSVLGTDQNVTTHVTKWQVDAEGVRRRFQGRNRAQNDIKLFDDSIGQTIEQLVVNGEDAVSLDDTTFPFAMNENEFLFLDFFASWCSHCRDLAPTWETLAEVMDAAAHEIVTEKSGATHDWTEEELAHAKKVVQPVMIAKIDCVSHQELCRAQNIRAYPTLRLFVNGEFKEDYRQHRTVLEMADWLEAKESEQLKKVEDGDATTTGKMVEAARKRMIAPADEKDWANKINLHKLKNNRHDWNDEEHPGCQITGHLMVDRVPGNFHIQARSNHHDLVPHMTNVSHVIHHLSIGEPMVYRMIDNQNVKVPDDVQNKLAPMNANVYVTEGLHEAYHHYLKVITTDVDGLSTGRGRKLKAYQIVQNSQLAMYRNDIVPEAKFIYDLSPISVAYKRGGRHWYDYFTSLMAIIGGTFTMVGMLESGINAAMSRKRRGTAY